MAVEFVSELSDKLGKNSTAANLPKHIKVISAPNYQRTDNGVVTNPSLQTALDGKAASTHSHGNITSDGKVGTTANKPLITTTGGAVTTGSFGTSANTFCQGNDSRLSDARTPTAHASTATTYGVGNSTSYGHVKLYDNITGSNTDGAPTQKAVKEAIAASEGGKVKATASSDNVEFKLLATSSASPTSGSLTEAVYDTGITMNPSTNTLTANLSGIATYAKALDPQMILNSTLYKVPVISADKEVRWTGAPGASGSTTELTYDNTDSKNLLSVNVTGYATSLEHAFSGSTVNETPIINVSGSTDGFKLTYGATTSDLGIAKLYTTDDANAKLSFGNMVSSTYKEALVITNGSADLTGTVNGYTIGTSVPSNAVFTDTTYESKAAVSGGTAVSLCTTGEKYTWNHKSTVPTNHASSSTTYGVASSTNYGHIRMYSNINDGTTDGTFTCNCIRTEINTLSTLASGKANPNIVQHKPYGESNSNCAVLFNADDPSDDVWVEVGSSSGSTSFFGYLLNSTQKQKLDNVIMSLQFVDAFPSSYTTGVLYLL